MVTIVPGVVFQRPKLASGRPKIAAGRLKLAAERLRFRLSPSVLPTMPSWTDFVTFMYE